jgi:hypothetical protein
MRDTCGADRIPVFKQLLTTIVERNSGRERCLDRSGRLPIPSCDTLWRGSPTISFAGSTPRTKEALWF